MMRRGLAGAFDIVRSVVAAVLLVAAASSAAAQAVVEDRRWFGPVEGPYVDPPVERRVLPPPPLPDDGLGPFDAPAPEDGLGPYDPPAPDDRFDPYEAPGPTDDPELYDLPDGPPSAEPPVFGDDPLGRPAPQTEPPQTEAPRIDPPQTESPQTEAPQTEPPPGFDDGPLYEPTPPTGAEPPPPSAEPPPPGTTDVPVVPDPMAPGIAAPPTLSPEALVDAVNSAAFGPGADFGTLVAGKLQQSPLVVKTQILLDRAGLSPGVIDGYYGFNMQKAVAAFEAKMGLPVDGTMDADAWTLLDMSSAEAVLIPYEITAADVAGPFEPDLPTDYAELAKLPAIAYRGPDEALAERFHMDLKFLRQINPGADFSRAGTVIIVADPGRPVRGKVASVVADKSTKQVIGYDAEGTIVVAYPATIGSSDLPSPTGRHLVEAIAPNPDYWYRPDVNFVQGENRKRLRLPPGPNGPVGTMWIDLSEPTYGIHGTPSPERIDKGFSHGCVRLTNWDAEELAGLVAPGVPVDFTD
jgi:lipoprotein-anchoring transpeptidase ErfK/SrfK